MATVLPRHERNDPNAGMQGAYYTVDIAMSGFTDAETTAGGRLSPCAANDFATKPTTLAQSLLVSRGQLRYKLMLNALQVRSNCRIINSSYYRRSINCNCEAFFVCTSWV